jgi:hypothetical protein
MCLSVHQHTDQHRVHDPPTWLLLWVIVGGQKEAYSVQKEAYSEPKEAYSEPKEAYRERLLLPWVSGLDQHADPVHLIQLGRVTECSLPMSPFCPLALPTLHLCWAHSACYSTWQCIAAIISCLESLPRATEADNILRLPDGVEFYGPLQRRQVRVVQGCAV